MKQLRKSVEKLSKTITQFTLLRLGVLFVLTISFGHAFDKVGASRPQIDALISKMDAIEGPLNSIEFFSPAQLFKTPLDDTGSTDCSVSAISTPAANPVALDASQTAALHVWHEACGQLAQTYDTAFRLQLTLLGAEADFDLRSWIYSIPFLFLFSEVYLSILRRKRELLVQVIAPRMLDANRAKSSLLDLMHIPGQAGTETAFDRFPSQFIQLLDVIICAALLTYLAYSAKPILDIWNNQAEWTALGLLCVVIFYLTAYRGYVARSLDAQVESLLSVDLPQARAWRFGKWTSNLLCRVRSHVSPRFCLPAGSVLVLLTLLLPICMVSCNQDQLSKINYGNGYKLIRGEGSWPSAFYLEHFGRRTVDESEAFPSEAVIARRSGRLTYIVAVGLAVLTLLIALLRRRRLTTDTGSALFRLFFFLSLAVLMFIVADSAFTILYIVLAPTNLYWVCVAFWLFGSTVAAGKALVQSKIDKQKWRVLSSATFILYTPLIVCSLFQFGVSVHDDWKNGLSALIYVSGVMLLGLGYAQ